MVNKDTIESYRRGWKKQEEKRRSNLKKRKDKLLEVANKAAKLLREKYHVDRVLLFGSLAREDIEVSLQSDVDLAVYGLNPEEFFEAQGDSLFIESDVEVNLVDATDTSKELKKVIRKTGIELVP